MTSADNALPWINPIGGYGDMLLVLGVLKMVNDRDGRRFNLLRRTAYQQVFEGHPAIAEVGHPPPGAEIIWTNYWQMEPLGPGEKRPFQILARLFGLDTPVEEKLWLPGVPAEDPLLLDTLPWKDVNILIAPVSVSPRKQLSLGIWEKLVDRLRGMGAFVVQSGRQGEPLVRGAYTVLDQTTPVQLISLLARFDLVITLDNFIMHGCKMMGIPTVAIWGPTSHLVYGYPEHVNIQMEPVCDPNVADSCRAPSDNSYEHLAARYKVKCPMGEKQCIDQVTFEKLWEVIEKTLKDQHPEKVNPGDNI
jgi:ADP-heptose:LPS heptosyltransferase